MDKLRLNEGSKAHQNAYMIQLLSIKKPNNQISNTHTQTAEQCKFKLKEF